ncbi:MAG: hypothetical protein EON90_13610, partial [Brevundimonas sp.]
MSAQALLSLSVSTVPTAPQGAASADASGFKGLLASMFDAAGSTDDAEAAPEADKDGDDKDVVGFLAAPVTLPVAAPVPILVSDVGAGATDVEAQPAPSGALPDSVDPEPAAASPPPSPTPAADADAPVAAAPPADPAEMAAKVVNTAVATASAEGAQQAVQAPPVAPPVVAAPPPLKPLADRTTKPLDPQKAEAAPSAPAVDGAA